MDPGVFVFSPEAQPDFQAAPAAIRYLLRPSHEVRFLDVRPRHAFLVLRGEPSFYVVVGEAPALVASLSQPVSRSQQPALAISAAGEVLQHLTPVRAAFDNGAVLAAVRVDCQADGLTVEQLWDLSAVPEEARARQYSLFNHLVDAGGQLLAQDDGLGPPSDSWRSGDWLLQRFRLEVPPQPAKLRTGLYSLIDGRRELTSGRDFAALPLPSCST